MRDLEAWISQTEGLLNYSRNGTEKSTKQHHKANSCRKSWVSKFRARVRVYFAAPTNRHRHRARASWCNIKNFSRNHQTKHKKDKKGSSFAQRQLERLTVLSKKCQEAHWIFRLVTAMQRAAYQVDNCTMVYYGSGDFWGLWNFESAFA